MNQNLFNGLSIFGKKIAMISKRVDIEINVIGRLSLKKIKYADINANITENINPKFRLDKVLETNNSLLIIIIILSLNFLIVYSLILTISFFK